MVWDNRCLLHKAQSYDTVNQPRVIRRCTVLGDAA
jgi:alpha-ketoglutarate-dependent taurine dioxygenase